MRPVNKVLMILCAGATLVSAETLLLLPMAGDVDKSGDAATINQLYRGAAEAQFKGTVQTGETGCADRVCALRAVLDSRADEVIYSTMSRLGSKWVFSSTILKNDGSNAFNQSLTASSIEDMSAVTRRMADALLNRQTVEKVATMDNIVPEDKESDQRRSLSASGVAAGYIWPLGDSYAHRDPLDSTKVKHPHSQIIRLSWMNTWELRNNLLLDADLVWGFADASFGADLSLDYVFSRSDFSPFIGGGLGLHYVFDDYTVDDERSSGPALNVQGGLLLFRTYDVHVMLRGQYHVIFNSDVTQSVSADLGFTLRKLNFWN